MVMFELLHDPVSKQAIVIIDGVMHLLPGTFSTRSLAAEAAQKYFDKLSKDSERIGR